MPDFTLVAFGTVREVYIVRAASEEEAREMFELSALDRPVVSEVLDTQLETITERVVGEQ